MTRSIQTESTTDADPIVRTAGTWCLVAAGIGVMQAAILLSWPSDVSTQEYSYPFHSGGFVVAQLTFCLQHLPLALGLAALLRLVSVRTSRTARVGVRVAVIGMLLLAVMELVAISAAGVRANTTRADVIDSLYAVPVVFLAVGAVVTGIGLRRSVVAASPTWLPILLLIMGVYVIVPMTPMLGSFVLGRLGIAGLMALFAMLGVALRRAAIGGRR